MNLLEIKTAVAAYFCMPTGAQVAVADLTVNGIDLFLVAANQAKQTASELHDFGFQRRLVQVTVNTATGGDINTAVDQPYGQNYIVKTLLDVGYIAPNGEFIPLEWTTAEESQERQRQENRYRHCLYRYPTDSQYNYCQQGEFRVEFRGDTILFWPLGKSPGQNKIIYLDAYVEDQDWVSDDLGNVQEAMDPTVDIWTTKASQYIQWQCICDLNNYFKSFVNRQEGNVPPPQERASTALQAFIDWDVFKYEQGRRHGR